MPPRSEASPHHFALNSAIVAAVSFPPLAATTLLSHRLLAHQSVDPTPRLRTVLRTALSTVAVVPEIWAEPHLVHHHFTDVNLIPIMETGDLLEWIDTQPAESRPVIPEVFNGLDPAAKGLSPTEVRELAAMVRPQVADLYDPPTSYTQAETDRLLDPNTPRYLYNKTPSAFAQMTGRGKSDWQLAPPRTILSVAPELRDSHSTALHRLGVWGIRLTNVGHYMVSAHYFSDKLSSDALEKSRRNSRIAQSILFGGNIALQAGINKKLTGRVMLGAAALTGTEIALATFGVVLAGGNFTNADGHAGERRTVPEVARDVYRAARDPEGSVLRNAAKAFFRFTPQVKSDGTYTTNTKIWSLFSLDEVGGQEDHHDRPWRRAYTTEKGWRKVVNAPFGSLIEALADRNILMRPGQQFGHPEVVEADEPLTLESAKSGTRYIRPDEPTLATLMLQAYRIRTLEAQKAT